MQLLPGTARAFEPYETGGAGMAHGTVTNPHVFVAIAADGIVTLTAHRSEMGTGSRTSLPTRLKPVCVVHSDMCRVALCT